MLSLTILALVLGGAPTDEAGRDDLSDKPGGFGVLSRGGEGGRKITVSTLADSGAGSLREALSAREPRTVSFGVTGTIELRSPIRVTSGRVTIDGQSAPGRGVTVMHHGIHFVGDCDDIIIRHLRIRVTTGGASGDALLFWGTELRTTSTTERSQPD